MRYKRVDVSVRVPEFRAYAEYRVRVETLGVWGVPGEGVCRGVFPPPGDQKPPKPSQKTSKIHIDV